MAKNIPMESRQNSRVELSTIHNGMLEDRQRQVNQKQKLTIINDKYFPYLDMEMYWNLRDELKFQVHMKPNQVLKYLNKDSTHLPTVFKAIPKGILNRLSKLTSISKKLERKTIDEIYPLHTKALQIAGLAPKKFPTFLELENIRNKELSKEFLREKKEKKKKRNRQTFFVSA